MPLTALASPIAIEKKTGVTVSSKRVNTCKLRSDLLQAPERTPQCKPRRRVVHSWGYTDNQEPGTSSLKRKGATTVASTSVAVRNTIRAGQVRVRGGRAAYYQQPTDAKPGKLRYAALRRAAPRCKQARSLQRGRHAGAGAGPAVDHQLHSGVLNAHPPAVRGDGVQHFRRVGLHAHVDVRAQQRDAGREGPHVQVVHLLHPGELQAGMGKERKGGA